MLTVGVIGIGNAGSQVAALARDELGVEAIAINSSEKDLETLPSSIRRIMIGDRKGAGKERMSAKVFLKESIISIIEDDDNKSVFKNDILFIISSTGGGTGSGASILLASVVKEVFPSTKVIVVGILPTIKEALSTQVNTLEYLQELYKTLEDPTYILYDNEKLAKEPSTVMMQKINKSIVDDINVIRGYYNNSTRFSSIDEKDMTNIISTTGRIAIASLTDIKEKDIDEVSLEDLLINEFKTNTHCEIQRDKIVKRTGIIVNLSDRLNDRFDTHIPHVQEFLGAPVEEFEHIVINQDRHMENNIFLIAAGLTQINDRLSKINDRIDEINELQKQMEEDSELSAIDIDEMNSKIERKHTKDSEDQIDIKNIFNRFGV